MCLMWCSYCIQSAQTCLVLNRIENVPLSTKDMFGCEIKNVSILNYPLLTKGCTNTFEGQHEISNNVVCVTNKASDQPAHARSLTRAFASRMTII